MNDLQGNGFNIIREYLQYRDKNEDSLTGDANVYKKKYNKDFLIVETYGDFIKEFNQWLRESKYYKLIMEEQNHDCISGEDWWIDYLTENNWGYDDEYIFCSHCDNVIHCNPTSGKVYNYWIDEGDIMCEDCIRENAEEYINKCLVINYTTGVPKTQIPINHVFTKKELCNYGFQCKYTNLEVGTYGIDIDPRPILKELIEKNKKADYICHCINQNPFATRYDIWERESEEE